MKITTHSEEETAQQAAKLAQEIKPGDILLLQGNLGVGKSVFARSLIRTLCDDETLEVPSPTFTLVQQYDSPPDSPLGEIWHFDLYRLKDPEEIYELGWEEALGEAITIVEWPERLGSLKPASYLDIRITSVENNSEIRMIQIDRV